MEIMLRTVCFDILSTGKYEPFQVPEGADVLTLLNKYYDTYAGQLEPQRDEFTEDTCVLINMAPTSHATVLHEGDKVIFLRTMAGG